MKTEMKESSIPQVESRTVFPAILAAVLMITMALAPTVPANHTGPTECAHIRTDSSDHCTLGDTEEIEGEISNVGGTFRAECSGSAVELDQNSGDTSGGVILSSHGSRVNPLMLAITYIINEHAEPTQGDSIIEWEWKCVRTSGYFWATGKGGVDRTVAIEAWTGNGYEPISKCEYTGLVNIQHTPINKQCTTIWHEDSTSEVLAGDSGRDLIWNLQMPAEVELCTKPTFRATNYPTAYEELPDDVPRFLLNDSGYFPEVCRTVEVEWEWESALDLGLGKLDFL